MTAVEQRILEALTELDTAAKRMSRTQASPKPNFLALFQQIEDLTRQLPKDADPSLLHYLHKKSYEKARLWLLEHQAESTP